MVLPLPVPPRPPEDAVRFINLERYPTFFEDMARGFPKRMVLYRGGGSMKGLSDEAPTLKVHEVGAFEASFVPRVGDFERLDERFRIPRDVWEQMPTYRDYGFAVFKLKASGQKPGLLRRLLNSDYHPDRVHPMAFEFPRRNPGLLYFPTVHIHDRKVHPSARFDHMLYCQEGPETDGALEGWEESDGPASQFMAADRTQDIVLPFRPCWRRPLEGRLENTDTLVGKEGSIPATPRVR
jgi:hypothetical protein